ncbi:unnamed protein product [Pleuronectes platessa]|uniref:Uncharacterized protein n=1 Tax=Pleuronectes platessa TaxID=8262 RepID=A0A9N7VDG7_PLEPL|nr:unnamed protein product [Pleuronectes platessa]
MSSSSCEPSDRPSSSCQEPGQGKDWAVGGVFNTTEKTLTQLGLNEPLCAGQSYGRVVLARSKITPQTYVRCAVHGERWDADANIGTSVMSRTSAPVHRFTPADQLQSTERFCVGRSTVKYYH